MNIRFSPVVAFACATLSLSVSLAREAHADTPQSDRLAAEALFNEGRTLLAQKNYDEACPKFAASQRLDPAVGTLLNLGDCYEHRGQLASAWLQYRDAAALALRRGNDERRAQLARDKASALEPRLPKLAVIAPAGVDVLRDGAKVDRATFGTAVPVDPGTHQIEASAPEKKPWRAKVDAKAGAVATITVPELEPDATAPPPEPPVVATPPPIATHPSHPLHPTPMEEPHDGGATRTVGLVVAAAGVVGLGIGTAFALSAKSKWANVTDVCPAGHCPDDATRVAQAGAADDARSAATLATISVVAGGALLVGGAVLFFTAPRSGARERQVHLTPAIGPGVAGVQIGGAFQ